MHEEKLAVFMLGLIVGLAIAGLSSGLIYKWCQQKAIEHNCANYDNRTGEWDWIQKGDR